MKYQERMTGGKEGEEGMRMKKVIGVVAVIAVVTAIVLIAFSSTASAESFNRTYTDDGGVLRYEGPFIHTERPKDAGNKSGSYEGETIRFWNKALGNFTAVKVSGPYESDGDPYDECVEDEEVLAGEFWDTEGKPTKGYFKVVDTDEHGGWFTVRKHSLAVELVGEKKKVQEGEDFSLRLKKNDRYEGVIKLTIKDDDGFSIEDEKGNDIYEVRVRYKEKDFLPYATADVVTAGNKTIEGISIDKDNWLVFNTSKLKMKEGDYTIILEDFATEADDDADIDVEEIYLEVECDDEVVKGDDIVIIIRCSFYEKEANVTVGDDWKNKTVTLDEEGKKKVKISTKDAEFGMHKITVEICGCDMKETKYVKVKKSGTSLKVPENATVGDIVHIEGTSESGDFAVVLVDDIFKKEARISSDDEFEWDWDTEKELDGYHGIDVFILSKVKHAEFSANYYIEDVVDDEWQRRAGVDASAGIFMLLPEFSMTVPKKIAEGDDIVINGTVLGADHVYVIVMNHKGEVMFPYSKNQNEIKATTTPVKEGKWEENIGELDSGRYVVIALYEGKDRITDAINETDKKWIAGDESKTLEQKVAILMDKITSAGSDDLFEKADFSVHAPKVILKEPKTVVEIGDEITVKAETNIKADAKAFVSLSQNSSILKKTFALVKNGCVTTKINTSGLQPGKYTVAVDVSGKASDEKEVTLVEKKEVVEEGKEEIAQNESLTEPVPEAAKEGNETVGEGEFLNGTWEGWEEVQKKIPVHVCDLLIAVVMAVFISFVVRRRR